MIVDITKSKISKSLREDICIVLAKMYRMDFFNFKESKSFLKKEIKDNNHIFIYIEENLPIGCMYANDYNYFNETFYENSCMSISNLYVVPEFRNQGIATEIIRYAEQVAKEEGCGRLVSIYKEKNKDSEVLHKKNGFEVIEPLVVVAKEF